MDWRSEDAPSIIETGPHPILSLLSCKILKFYGDPLSGNYDATLLLCTDFLLLVGGCSSVSTSHLANLASSAANTVPTY